MDEAELKRIQGGDRAVFSELIRAHQRSVFFLALRMSSGDEALARDIAQKTFLQAWRNRASFRGDSSFKTWLLRIASNLSKNELRRAWRKREVVPSEGIEGDLSGLVVTEQDSFEALATEQARAFLRQAVANLPEQQQRVAILRLYEDMSFAEVGEHCGITANNAKVNFHHAVRNIRKFLAAQGVAA